MYDELVKRLKEDKSWVEQGTTQTEHEIAEHIQQAADAIEELTGLVQEAERDRDEYRERLDKANCAIEELQKRVPKVPHGRLIDADAIRADIDEKRPGRSYEDAWTLTVIDAAPTIIEAEEGE